MTERAIQLFVVSVVGVTVFFLVLLGAAVEGRAWERSLADSLAWRNDSIAKLNTIIEEAGLVVTESDAFSLRCYVVPGPR